MMLAERPLTPSADGPEPELEKFLQALPEAERAIFSLDTVQDHPNLNPNINIVDAARLLEEFFSGLLEQHDDSLPSNQFPRRGGKGASTLTSIVEAGQVRRVLRLLGLMRHCPPDSEQPEKGWFRYLLEHRAQALGTQDDPPSPEAAFSWEHRFGLKLFALAPLKHNPIYHRHLANAYVLFANLLYHEAIRGT